MATVELSFDANKMVKELEAVLADKSLPASEAYCACCEVFDWLSSSELPNLQYYDINQLLVENQPAYVAPLVKGHYYITMAWEWRGSGYADHIRKLQWDMFSSKLNDARSALEEAWELNPHEPLIACDMMTVELGQGKGRQQLELWFNRAMDLDTNGYYICANKLNYLEPKWYGSAKEMLDFGQQCAESPKWGGKVPLILVLARKQIANYFAEPERAKYWKLPVVWSDINKAYSKYLSAHPDDFKERQEFAKFAYDCEQWGELNNQLPQIGPPVYKIFGGRAAFEKIVQAAKDHNQK